VAIDKDRTITINGDFTMELSGVIAKSIIELSASSTIEPIYILINSNGGNIRALRTIMAALKNSTCKIITITIGVARSSGAILFLLGEERLMFQDSELLFHEPRGTCTNCTYLESLEFSSGCKEDYNFVIDEILKKTNLTKKKLKSKITNKHYVLTPEEAVIIGAATHIITDFSQI